MKNKKLYNILLISLIIIYIWVVYQFNFCTINYHIIESVIALIPLVIYVVIFLLLKKDKIKDLTANVLIIISIIIFFTTIFFSFVVLFLEEGTSNETNPYRYNHIKNIAGYTNYTYQFPKEISDSFVSDRNVKFYYSPQFLQGAFNFNLLMDLDDNEINNYIEKYEDKAKIIIDMKENDKSEIQQYIVSEPYGIFEYDDYEEFIKKAKFYIFESEPYEPDNWNHGIMQYMAKNEDINQLLLVTKIW